MKLFKVILFFCAVSLFGCQTDNSESNSTGFQGIVELSNTIGGTQEDYAYSIINTFDGNIAMFGHTASMDGDITDKTITGQDYWLTLLNQNGEILWTKTYGGSGDDRGQKLIQTSDGGFAMAGYSMSSDGDASNNEGFHDNWLIKTDANGNLLWEKSFGFVGHDHAYSLIETADGGLFMAGFLDVTASGGAGNTNKSTVFNRHGVGEFWCHKLDAQGNIQWQRYFGGSSNDRAYGAVQANDGGFIVTGYSESTDFDITDNKGTYDYWVIKINAVGDLIWSKNFGGTGIDQARSIVKTEDGNYIVAGNSFSTDGDISNNNGSSDYWLVKINDAGDLLWQKNFGGLDFDYATSIRSCREGFIVTGYSRSKTVDASINYGDNDFWILKVDHDGQLLWQKNFGGSSLDLAFDAVETQQGNLFIVGETESNDYDVSLLHGLKDVLLVKVK